eukprot:CAMPEP_0197830892 /NCGR_PEP_ID=MMETSP1437-20131217/7502_1 /TAXON_ID=49252 ORGANISM="Eucampia antarctica, Strain CCMP1452" /NCGR_SAMPLE_ID=MMETSP1437 /ASSEMBLY_ACC=CAM_ASM_001096 /LENGTH=282 /DNA_ID=CAMNT_0043433575 /DNA_START=55 /DNA_END=903 /DNA_ORIENTATION=-
MGKQINLSLIGIFLLSFSIPVLSFVAIGRKLSVPSGLASSDVVDNDKKYMQDKLEQAKSNLLRLCSGESTPSSEVVKKQVQDLEQEAEQIGVGQCASLNGVLSGEWELVYSPEDITRSSPFFWAFQKAFPENSDQIFAITDVIPAPVKDVGPAIQYIDLDAKTFVSRVKVATLGGLATSLMTTRATIIGEEGFDGLRLKILSTKPEDSTVLQRLGPFGKLINENSPPFPSGEALERAVPGSSEVIMKTTFCDESIRISRNADQPEEPFVWKRLAFGSDNFEV